MSGVVLRLKARHLLSAPPCAESRGNLLSPPLDRVDRAGIAFRSTPREISQGGRYGELGPTHYRRRSGGVVGVRGRPGHRGGSTHISRSEEHTSELQSLRHLVCRL